MINCFEEIRNRLDIRTVVEYYGIEIKRNHTCLCPFHDDHHPSAHIYPNAFHCFTCNVHYDVLGFVMALFDLSAFDAERKLNDDFQLGIAFGKQKTPYKPTYNGSAELREIRRKNVNTLKNGKKRHGRLYTNICGLCVIGWNGISLCLRISILMNVSILQMWNIIMRRNFHLTGFRCFPMKIKFHINGYWTR